MDQYDKNHQGQIDFGDFLRMFRHKLLDLEELMKYMSMKSAGEQEQQQQQPQQASVPSQANSLTFHAHHPMQAEVIAKTFVIELQ